MLEAVVQLQPGDVVVQNGATSAVGQVGCSAEGGPAMCT
jgi:NADPH:quinone reductase-like Zn-dependent oxidoreductase